jgi:hypothetical protein
VRRLCVYGVAVLLLLYIGNDTGSFYTLNISRDSGENLVALPVSPGDRWAIHFTHSWYRVPQNEIYRLDRQGGMVLTEVNFGSYPAALYYNENPSQGFVQEGNCWKIKSIDRSLAQVRFKVGYTTNCRLIMKEEQLHFTSLARGGESLVFTVRRASVSKYLYALISSKMRGIST